MVIEGDASSLCCISDSGIINIYSWAKKQLRRVNLQTDRVSYAEFNVNSCILALCYPKTDSQWCLEVMVDVLLDSSRSLGQLQFPIPILQLVLRNDYLCVVFEDGVSIYSVPNLHLIRKQPTFSNPGDSCCAMSMDIQKLVLACLGMQRGTVRIERISSPPSSSVIAAHDTGIVSIGLSGNGLHVATSSERGTLIRIHSTFDDCALLYEVRRSLPIFNPTTQHRDTRSLFMSPNGSFLASLTNAGEITVYKLASSCVPESTLTNEPKSFSNLYNRYIGPLSSTSPWFTMKVPTVKHASPIPIRAQFGSIQYTLIISVNSNVLIYRFDGGEPNKVVLSRCDRITPTEPDESLDVTYTTELPSPDDSSSSPDWVVVNETDEIFPNDSHQFW